MNLITLLGIVGFVALLLFALAYTLLEPRFGHISEYWTDRIDREHEADFGLRRAPLTKVVLGAFVAVLFALALVLAFWPEAR